MYTPITGVGTGVAPTVNITWPFVDKDDVKANIDGNPATLTWTGASQVQFTTVVPSGTSWEVYRDTDITSPVVDFTSGSVLTADDLNSSRDQTLHSVEEQRIRVNNFQGELSANTAAIAAMPVTAAGTYIPTIVAETGPTGVSISKALYSRVGNIVTVSLFGVTIGPLTEGGNNAFKVSLPVASNLTSVNDLAGGGATQGADGIMVTAATDGSDYAELTWTTTAAGEGVWLSATFQYQVK